MNSNRESSRMSPPMRRMGGPGGFRGGPAIGMPVEKPKNFKATFWRFTRYFRPYFGRLVIVFVAAIVSTVFNIVSPKLLGNATTALFQGVVSKMKGVPGAGVDFRVIAHILVMLAVLYVTSALFGFIQQYVMAGVAQETVYTLRKEVNEKLSRLPIRFFDSRPHGDILSRFVNDFDNIANTLQQSLTQAITSSITLLGVIVMMLSINPLMTVVIFLTLPLSLILIRSIASRSQKYFAEQQKSLGQLNGHVEEMYTGHQIVKAFGHETTSIQEFDSVNDKLYQANWKAQFVSGIIMPLMNSVGNLGFVFVSVMGGILVLRGTIQIGDVQAFIQYARQFSQPITQLSSIANIIQSTIASAERVFELLDELPESDEGNEFPENAKGHVRFDNVTFSYTEDAPLLKEIHMNVKSGQTIAIVGPTGAGKTTLVNLLMRFYDISGGSITIDGVDISHMNRGRLRSMLGMVLQDTWLFHGTIRDNIAYGRQGARDAEVVEAAKAAYADHFIRTLPDGYQTVLNEEASNISQGQRQLLAIARAILADPKILILDEATSNVDTRTEVHIQNALLELMKGRTSFVIAHRLSTIRNADLILVMNNGRLVEQGTHAELLAKHGFYAELYQSQFSTGAKPTEMAQ